MSQTLEARLVTIESRLGLGDPAPATPQHDKTEEAWSYPHISPGLYSGHGSCSMTLPLREEMQPIIDHYFESVNSVTPLFHHETFMHMLESWRNEDTCDSRVEWAAIQIVLALGLWTMKSDAGRLSTESVRSAKRCLNNAQSVLSELVVYDKTTLGIQVLLAIVLLFQSSSDQKPASMLVAIVIRLVHRLGLHSSAPSSLCAQRVFWVAYVLDKVSQPKHRNS